MSQAHCSKFVAMLMLWSLITSITTNVYYKSLGYNLSCSNLAYTPLLGF